MTEKELFFSADSHKEDDSRSNLSLSEIQVEAIGRELGEPGWLIDERRSSLEQFRRLEMPSSRDIYWRRSGLTQYPFSNLNLEALALSGKPKHVTSSWLHPGKKDELDGQMICEDGHCHDIHLEEALRDSGVIFTSVSQAAKQFPEKVRDTFGGVLPASTGKFEAFISSSFDSSFLIIVPKGVHLKKPLHTLLWSSGSGLRVWRLYVKVEEGAEATLLHECASANRKEPAARLGMIELLLQPDAKLNFFQTQSWGNNIVSLSIEKASIMDKANLQWGFANLGSQTGKTFSTVDLLQPGASAKWTGCCLLDGNQNSDVSTFQNHCAQNTKSDVLYKGTLQDSSRSHWQGLIRVERGVAGSDGYQANRMLILSEQARAESLPELEILSDDVRCSHGVSIGELDPEEMFYLRSRGIPDEDARRLLVEGFIEPILNNIPQEVIRRHIRLVISEKMKIMQAQQQQVKTESKIQEGLAEAE
jgi:Fe-S cluster assembly protein SufD